MQLDWGREYCITGTAETAWKHSETNIALDFHGDPITAELSIFSDGNHHMALLGAVQGFCAQYQLQDIFYTSTPPGPLVSALRGEGLRLGNLLLSRRPHVFISPEFVLNPLYQEGIVSEPRPLFSSRGNVLLVAKGNPCRISSVVDLAQRDIKVFLSNPVTEKASYLGYSDTLRNLGADPESLQIVYGEHIHHREAPQAVADRRVDCAVVYYHLALRYVRLFPEYFEIIPLGGTVDAPLPEKGNVVTSSALSLVGDGGPWGAVFLDYMRSREVAEIYHHHGMLSG